MNYQPQGLWLGLLALIAVAIMIWLAINFANRRASKLDRNVIRQQWNAVLSLANDKKTARYGLIEADKVLDGVLKTLRFPGASMGDRLKSAGVSLGNQNAIWSAHKLRNQLVHETNYLPKSAELSRAIQAIGKALKHLGAL